MRQEADYVLRTVEERGIRFVQLWFTDVLGTPKGFSITPAELEHVLEEGMTFDGSAIDGFSRVQEADMLVAPDANTFQILPWQVDDVPVARMVCDILNPDLSPFEGCPRHVLRKALRRANERGYKFFAAPEIEYFYFASSSLTGEHGVRPIPLDSGSYFDLTVTDLATELRKRTVLTLEDMGIPVEHTQHEDAPSQHEIDLRYTDALTMADTIMTVRLIVKGLANEQGVHASFMPKPMTNEQGSGMHTHFSLFENELNAFSDPDDEYGLSVVAKKFIAGVLHFAPEITAVTNQWVNSYKRLVPGYEAPVNVSWARNNRSALVRVPVVREGILDAARIEYRAPDAACNPYLTFALILEAGLKGIEDDLVLPEEAITNLYKISNGQSSDEHRQLPGDLQAAVDLMEKSELVANVLGEHVFEWFIKNKRSEWAGFAEQVTHYELERYLPSL
ncbi:MAG: type I glutamate--ammonia ligase [Acidimicrobiales bacterium]|nr:type I glutamate--ammonia ligase [Acidimicrobiales bacterium]